MLSRRSAIWIGLAVFVAAAVAAAVTSTRLFAIYNFLWGRDRFWSLFYEGLGLGDNISTLLSMVATWIYVFAFAGFTAFLVRSLFARDFKRHVLGFVSFIAFFALAPLVHVVYQPVGPTVCFNQKDGTALKWYVVRGGKIFLFDSDGFDPLDGLQKLRVTPDICRTFELQRASIFPSKINLERAIDLYPNVWYASFAGNFELFDNPGVYPGTTELLKPVPEEMINQIRVRLDTEKRERMERERQRIDEENRRREAERLIEGQRLAKEQLEREAEIARNNLEQERDQARKAEIERRERARLDIERREREKQEAIRKEAERREQLRFEREQRERDREANLRAAVEREQRARKEEQEQCYWNKMRAGAHCGDLDCRNESDRRFNC